VTTTGNYSSIHRAIRDRKQIHATYRGLPREMCPHVLGTKNGRRQALFFQFAGESERGLPPGGGWRCLPVDELTALSLRDGPWFSHSDYSPAGACVDLIDIAI
jgi:hypothetical protein